jgi:hypothetical protein
MKTVVKVLFFLSSTLFYLSSLINEWIIHEKIKL